jgi:competence ComEA-like helix-hairpin-helix protein
MSNLEFLKEYFRFSKKDRIGLISLLSLTLIIYFLPFFFGSRKDELLVAEQRQLLAAADSLQHKAEEKAGREDFKKGNSRSYDQPFVKKEVFIFDPNTLESEGWKRLGLPDRSIKTLMNYRSKGGKFYRPEDLQKIWGLPNGFYEAVKDHVRITSPAPFSRSEFTKTAFEKKKIEQVDINQGDTSEFIALPGIGSKLAARIILFREKLGGFHSVEQVGEVYGLQDSTFQKIKPFLMLGSNGIRKIRLNTATKEEIKAHPYFKWSLANAIVEYRNVHGKFNELSELKKITIIDEPVYRRILPYLEL